MDAAGYALQSDPELNRHFRRRWDEDGVRRAEGIPVMRMPRTLEQIAAELSLDWRRHARPAA